MTETSTCRRAEPRLLTTCDEARQAALVARGKGQTVGLVPTMGALHEGHLSLVDASTSQCGMTFVTIFVNPTQFGPGEDYQRYPRSLEADLATLARRGVDVVFAPGNEEMYPPGHSTFVDPPAVAHPLEGRCRSGHFRGVSTVVLKLFHAIPADIAFFGQKDYQQTLVVRRMVTDLDVPIEIHVCPIIREPDGLALSSRNAYLSQQQRHQALSLSRSLELAARLYREGQVDAATIAARMRAVLVDAGVENIDYVALADPETLADVSTVDSTTMALIAAQVGNTRLIDNRQLNDRARLCDTQEPENSKTEIRNKSKIQNPKPE